MGMKVDSRGGRTVKNVTKGLGLLVVLAVVLWVVTPGLAKEPQEPQWSPAQQEVLQWLEHFEKVQMTEPVNIEEHQALYHPRMQNWNFSNEALPRIKPLVRGDYEYLWERYRQTLMELQPVTIEVIGNVAVVNLLYRERWTERASPTGESGTYFGAWTLTLIKKNDKWQHFNWTWTAKKEGS